MPPGGGVTILNDAIIRLLIHARIRLSDFEGQSHPGQLEPPASVVKLQCDSKSTINLHARGFLKIK